MPTLWSHPVRNYAALQIVLHGIAVAQMPNDPCQN